IRLVENEEGERTFVEDDVILCAHNAIIPGGEKSKRCPKCKGLRNSVRHKRHKDRRVKADPHYWQKVYKRQLELLSRKKDSLKVSSSFPSLAECHSGTETPRAVDGSPATSPDSRQHGAGGSGDTTPATGSCETTPLGTVPQHGVGDEAEARWQDRRNKMEREQRDRERAEREKKEALQQAASLDALGTVTDLDIECVQADIVIVQARRNHPRVTPEQRATLETDLESLESLLARMQRKREMETHD
ncbi:hypothetical protein KIPB_010656, partial [Kipferlia bialata]